MKKKDVIHFFDHLAHHWDADMIRSDETINTILDNAEVRPGVSVLDVACGTGVLVPDYLKRDVRRVIGVDISREMVKIARSKFPQQNIMFFNVDVEEIDYEGAFDIVMVYNAFPHFPDPEGLIARLSRLLKPGGTLTVAHGMSRVAIDSHHEGTASKVSMGLMSEEDLAAIFQKYLTVTVKISNEKMYQVTGKKEKIQQ